MVDCIPLIKPVAILTDTYERENDQEINMTIQIKNCDTRHNNDKIVSWKPKTNTCFH